MIRLHPKQWQFSNSNALYRAFLGGRGSGKSFAGAYDLLKRAKRNCTYTVVGPTSGQLHDSSLQTFRKLAWELGLWKDWSASTQTAFLTTGATIRFRSADNPERLRGPDLSGCWLDEGSLMDREALEICQACLREHGKQGWLSCTFTAKGLSHWTYELFGSLRPNTEVFTSHTGENPFLPKDFEEQLREQWGSTPFARQELEGAFVALEGAEWPGEYFDTILYDQFPLHPRDVFTHIVALDPSKGKQAKAGDYSALLHVIASRDLHLYLEDAHIARLPTDQVESATVAYIQEYQPGVVIVEANGFQEVLADNILKKCQQLSIPCPLHPFVNTVDKATRIRMLLTPYLAQKRLHIRKCPATDMVLAQMRDFPVCTQSTKFHDDAIDALHLAAIGFHNLLSGIWQAQRKNPPPSQRHVLRVK